MYLLHRFDRAFFDYAKAKLNAESSYLIYDLLVKIGEHEEMPLNDVQDMIIHFIIATLKSDHFTQIDQETLINLLSLDRLHVTKIDLFEAASKWVDHEVQRQGLLVNGENRRRVF